MLRTQVTSWVAVALAFGALTVSASAFPVGGGAAQDETLGDVGGWHKSWVHFRWEKFDRVALRIMSPGDNYAADAVSDLSRGWELTYASGDLVVLERETPGHWLGFTLNFGGSYGDVGDQGSGWDIATSWVTFLGRDSIESVSVNHGEFATGPYDWGGGWRGEFPGEWNPSSWAEVEAIMVPLPAPVAMGAVGLVVVILGRKRIRRLVG
jgi:hypothetical protein